MATTYQLALPIPDGEPAGLLLPHLYSYVEGASPRLATFLRFCVSRHFHHTTFSHHIVSVVTHSELQTVMLYESADSFAHDSATFTSPGASIVRLGRIDGHLGYGLILPIPSGNGIIISAGTFRRNRRNWEEPHANWKWGALPSYPSGGERASDASNSLSKLCNPPKLDLSRTTPMARPYCAAQ